MRFKSHLSGAAIMICGACLAETDVSYRFSYEQTSSNDDSVFFFERTPNIYEQVVDLELQQNQFIAQLDGVVTQEELHDGSDQQDQIELRQAWYDSSFGHWDISIGKKYLAWDVGYSVRPIDIFGTEADQGFSTGVNMILLEYYGATSTQSLVCSDNVSSESSLLKQWQTTCAAKIYQLTHSMEWQGLLVSQEETSGLGGSFSLVMGQSLEIHGSGLLVGEATKTAHRLAGTNELIAVEPLKEEKLSNPGHWLFGFNYSTASGLEVLVEWQHDDLALTGDEWSQHIKLAKSQRQELIVSPAQTGPLLGNIGSSASLLLQPSLISDRLVTRVSYRGESLEPAMAVISLLPDHGHILVAELSLTHWDHLDITLEYDQFIGNQNTLAYQIPVNNRLETGLTWHF